MRSAELRQLFFDFFTQSGHRKVPSAPLIPAKDPTLLFTNAGMNQFKDVFTGKETREFSRAVSIQKCLRVSGKHNDFDEVGKTDHHHTFFEMMGNFSFGDYFKKKAVRLAWDFLTTVLKLPKDRLWITVFKDDQETYRIWQEDIQIPADRILKSGENDNFWQMGETGPCGPCSEIHYDRGDSYGPPDFLQCPGRFVEIWNLVFIQFDRQEDGTLSPLPRPSIDTGMGMERLTAVMQGVTSNYDTDLFRPIKEYVEQKSPRKQNNPGHTVDLNIIADHARAATFLIADSISPSNEGRGYVLRRIIRRASKHGRALGFESPFLGLVCQQVIDIMAPHYPQLETSRELITKVVTAEEKRFLQTLTRGLIRFEELVKKTLNKHQRKLPGGELFRLSDTFGFPLDFAMDLARERDLSLDLEGYQQALEEQRRQSQKSRKKPTGFSALTGLKLPRTRFQGYQKSTLESRILALLSMKKKPADRLGESEKGFMIVESTPFYAQGGGQTADIGQGDGNDFYLRIDDVLSIDGYSLHQLEVLKGEVRTGELIQLTIDRQHRQDTAVHHSLTHMLHWALREVLGDHVRQSGSSVQPDRLRFDFTHHQALGEEDLMTIERLVNEKIQNDEPVADRELPYEEAIRKGALAFFDEKYSDRVRSVTMGDWSHELCGGTHLNRTGQAGIFKIIEESSISAGIRRIEAKGGRAALAWIQETDRLLRKVIQKFQQPRDSILDHLLAMRNENRELKKRVTREKKKKASRNFEELINRNTQVQGIPLTVACLKEMDKQSLGQLADDIKRKTGGVAVLYTPAQSKTFLVVSINSRLTDRLNANRLIREIVEPLNGKGGGKPDFAQAGGDPAPREPDFQRHIESVLARQMQEQP